MPESIMILLTIWLITNKDMIIKDILIEELINKYPGSVLFLSERGIKCIQCGEPIWGTLEETCCEKGFNSVEIDIIIDELNNLGKFEKI
jgi:hypothetical protein